MNQYLLAIDQGTTSSRAILFDASGHSHGVEHSDIENRYPADGYVEQDPEQIWQSVLHVCRVVIADNGLTADQIRAIGIANQRETTLVWDRQTGDTIYPAIVWQDRRTADFCHELQEKGLAEEIHRRTGLFPDPYFSATKIRWILENVPGARDRAERGELAFGTIDCFLLWRFNKGQRHQTDATNASRTMLYNIHENAWDSYLLDLFDIPESLLPEVSDCAADFGTAELLGRQIPITGVAGDQQAALLGQACTQSGMVKSTYGTGCFMVLNTGDRAVLSTHRLLTTIGYRLEGKTTYAMEGSIFIAGAAVQWLRDAMKMVENAAQTEEIAAQTPDTGGVYLVPAFTGLGTPHWDPDARGALLGLTRDSGLNQVVRATLESVSYQTRDLLEAMEEDGISFSDLRVDGGMVANNWLMQHLADTLGIGVQRPVIAETTALGAAFLAGLGHGLFDSLDGLTSFWKMDREWQPEMDEDKRKNQYRGWQEAVARVRTG